MRRTWTDKEIELLIAKYPITTHQELSELLPAKTPKAIRGKAKVLGLKKTRKRYKFTDTQLLKLSQLYPTTLNNELAKIFECPVYTITNAAYRLGLKKDMDFLKGVFAERMKDPDHPGRRHQFTRGHIPENKGKKWSEFMPEESQAKSRQTCFKKGSIPPNAYKDWEIITRQCTDRDEPAYKYIRVPGREKLVPLHRHIWEQTNGPIPKGFNVVFKDGDTMNCDISNLEMISNRDNMLRNTIHRYPDDIRRLIQANGALKRQINKRSKQD